MTQQAITYIKETLSLVALSVYLLSCEIQIVIQGTSLLLNKDIASFPQTNGAWTVSTSNDLNVTVDPFLLCFKVWQCVNISV